MLLPNDDRLARGNKEPIPAIVLLPLLPALPGVLVRTAEELYGLSVSQTLTLLSELHRERLVITDRHGLVTLSKLEK